MESTLNILNLADKIGSYLEPDQVKIVKRAYYFAEQAHEPQRRRSGEPYVVHPLTVASILSDMYMDHESLSAAMLHDVIEDTAVTKDDISKQFGEQIADLVDGVSKLTQIEFNSQAEAQAENFQKMTLAMSKDIRVILVKLADRLHNMRTLGVMKPEKRRRISKETLEIYSPIANRLGMNDVRMEFEDLCFQNIYPMRATRISAALQASFKKRDQLIEETRQVIENHLMVEGLNAQVYGRQKHLFSIYQKMRSSGKSFKDITDVFGFRIIVNNADTCYRALGAMHALFKPVSGQFKDYIAIPKSNGYQSLHTILIGMHGVPIEVQIRTEDMDEMANNGIAAHWLYKQDQEYSNNLSGSHKRARQWVQNLLEMQQRTGNSLEFIENVKIDLFPDEVYVFTPNGKILELPQGATAIDFAYAVHTDLGNQCVGCYINRRLSPLSQPLQSGETVDIITSPNGQPSPVWLDFVVTGKARSHIRHSLKQQRYNESIKLGERLLNKALNQIGSSIENVPEAHILAILQESGHDDFNEILEDIGLGNRASSLTAQQLVETDSDTVSDKDKTNPLVIAGTEGMVLNFAKCCHPLPGDNIIGFMTAGRGVVVHTSSCPQAKAKRKESPIELRWSDDIQGEFSVPIRIELKRERSAVAALATKINSLDGNIENLNLIDIDAYSSRIDATISVKDRVHLARIFRHIRNIKPVTSVSRVKDISKHKKRSLH